MRSSLQIKMVLIMVLLAVSVMLVVGTMLVNNVVSFYNDDFLRQVENFFNEDMVLSLQDAGESGVDIMYSRMSLYASQLGIDTYRNFYIMNYEGKLLSGSNIELGSALDMTPNLLAGLSGRVGDGINTSARYMDYAVPIGEEYVVYIKDSKDEVRDLTWEIVVIIVETMLVTLISAILLSFLLARTITNPIEKLTVGAARVASGDFSEPLPVSSKDEIGTLTETFNSMSEILKSTLDDIEGERNKFMTIFLYLTDGVAVFDGSGRLLHINRAACEMLGGNWIENEAGFEDVFPSHMVDIAPLELIAEEAGAVRDLTAGSRTLRTYFASFMLPQQPGSMTEGFIAVIHDITEEERLNAARREFIANVSHELRTPLTNIKSYTETVVESPELSDEKKNSFLQVVLNESDRMIRIVKDLLTLSRLDSDKLDLHPRLFGVADMLRRVYDAMRIDAENHRHVLTLEIGNVGEIIGDVERIEQVIVNIVSNAIKYTPDGGRISLTASRGDDHVKIVARDNGMGISEKDRARIFERFYRVDKARSREKGGTGLGLAIAKEIVEASGGSIDLISELGSYTEVTVCLPIAN